MLLAGSVPDTRCHHAAPRDNRKEGAVGEKISLFVHLPYLWFFTEMDSDKYNSKHWKFVVNRFAQLLHILTRVCGANNRSNGCPGRVREREKSVGGSESIGHSVTRTPVPPAHCVELPSGLQRLYAMQVY